MKHLESPKMKLWLLWSIKFLSEQMKDGKVCQVDPSQPRAVFCKVPELGGEEWI